MPLDRASVLNVVRMVRFFEAGGQARSADLAERYGVCPRTIQRWLVAIDEVVPLERRGRGGAIWRRRRV